MAKFKISFKITGFELNIEGNREDVPLITQAVGQQFAGLLGPASEIIEGDFIDRSALPDPASDSKTVRKTPRKRPPSSAKPHINNSDKKDLAVDWRHDSSKWGTPQQDWVTAEKSIWLLYVVVNETDEKELTGHQIADTFNKHFRQSGQLRLSNVGRDLGVKKRQTPALVNEDATKNPSTWYLTTAGNKRAQELVVKARGENSD